jgi:hypothetical protein
MMPVTASALMIVVVHVPTAKPFQSLVVMLSPMVVSVEAVPVIGIAAVVGIAAHEVSAAVGRCHEYLHVLSEGAAISVSVAALEEAPGRA